MIMFLRCVQYAYIIMLMLQRMPFYCKVLIIILQRICKSNVEKSDSLVTHVHIFLVCVPPSAASNLTFIVKASAYTKQ